MASKKKRWIICVIIIVLCSASPIMASGMQNLGMVRYIQLVTIGTEGSTTWDWQDLQLFYAYLLDLPNCKPEVLRSHALVLAAQRQWEAAAEIMNHYQGLRPQDELAIYLLGDWAWQRGDYKEAVNLWLPLRPCQHLLTLAKQSIINHDLELALFLLDTVRPNISDYGTGYQAIELYKSLLILAPSSKELICTDGAMVFERTIRMRPSQGFLQINYGTFLRNCGEFDRALEVLAIDSHFSPSLQAWASSEIGLTYLHMDRLDMALKAFEYAVVLEPTHDGYKALFDRTWSKLVP